jgi:hypothetical protein
MSSHPYLSRIPSAGYPGQYDPERPLRGRESFCRYCGALFSADSAADTHWRGGRCLSPEEMLSGELAFDPVKRRFHFKGSPPEYWKAESDRQQE